MLDTKLVIRDPQTSKKFREPFNSTVEFRNVSFRYPGAEEDVLHDITFTAQPGQTTAFIGSTGSGKSTVVNLIPRFYDITGGSILVDGTDIREVSQHDLREKIGYIPQKGPLFSGTIESNLLYADENASLETMNEAIEIAQAAEFVTTRPEGMAAEISQGGANVSQGQKQLLTIARAVLSNPRILILDEATSSVDTRTEVLIQRAMNNLMKDRTSFIIAHRRSIIRDADWILVMRDGDIVEQGSHEELLAQGAFIAELYNSQFERAMVV
ncbi:MAG: ATP-binding cassette domain-containing protein [Anaerolineaceae bacterium]|nr:ATP-binding cassette domain-containing protein [Anaerolineaceae bacterium]